MIRVLNQLITQAPANNNQIQMAQGNIMQAQAQLKAAQYSWLPTLCNGWWLYRQCMGY